ncbi:hypothetical protein GCM10027043_51050 [Ferruginibacter profundus]
MWLDRQVSLYTSHADNTGKAATFRDILFTQFAANIGEICKLRSLNIETLDYKIKTKSIKAKLQAFTPAALLRSKAKGQVEILEPSGLMQLDFDYKDIRQFDIEDLKQAVFDLPFIAFCGLSCSGKGFYALALISEPEKLEAYADHCFEILKGYGIQPDESKGKKPENLRYVSYDANMLYRHNPEPLKISRFKTKQSKKREQVKENTNTKIEGNNGLVNKLLNDLNSLQAGSRTRAVQKIAFTLGGLNMPGLLDKIKHVINGSSVFKMETDFFLKCAEDCYNAGVLKPWQTN